MHHGIGHMIGYPGILYLWDTISPLAYLNPLWDTFPLWNTLPPVHQMLLASDGHHWNSVQTCSFEALPPTTRLPSPGLTSSGGNRSGRYAP